MHFQLLVTGIAVSVRIYLQSSQMFSMIYDENNKVGQSNGAHSEKCAQKCMILLIPIKTRHFSRHPQFINKKKNHQSKHIYNKSLVSAVSLVYWFHCAVSLKVKSTRLESTPFLQSSWFYFTPTDFFSFFILLKAPSLDLVIMSPISCLHTGHRSARAHRASCSASWVSWSGRALH